MDGHPNTGNDFFTTNLSFSSIITHNASAHTLKKTTKLLWFFEFLYDMGKRDATKDPPGKPTIHRKRGKRLLHKKESVKEFTVKTKIKYASCMDQLLEGDRLKDGELSELCCKNTREPITNFTQMTSEAIDQHLYKLFLYPGNQLSTGKEIKNYYIKKNL